jgi:hypothetical protein
MARSALRDSWERRKARAFPPGAVTFHLSAWSRESLTPEEGAAAGRLMQEHGFSGLLILHGNALFVGGRVVLLLGPAGIGKSTASRRLVRLGAATLIEDGLVVVGEEPGGWRVVETGTLGVLHGAARIAAFLRRVVPAPSAFGSRAGRWRAERRQRGLRRVVDALAFKGGVFLAGRPRTAMAPRLLAVARVEHFAPASSEPDSFRVDGRGLAGIEELAALVPPGIAYRRHSLAGPVRQSYARVVAALLGDPDDGRR